MVGAAFAVLNRRNLSSMTLNKFIRKANSYLREARKHRKWVILGMAAISLAISYVLANGLVIGNNGIIPPSEMINKMEGNSIDKRFLKRNENPLKAHPSTALVGINTSSLDQGQIASLLETAEKEEEERKAREEQELIEAEKLKKKEAALAIEKFVRSSAPRREPEREYLNYFGFDDTTD